jgi:hypothetical protein
MSGQWLYLLFFVVGAVSAVLIVEVLRDRSFIRLLRGPERTMVVSRPIFGAAQEAAQSRRRFLERALGSTDDPRLREIIEPVPGLDVAPGELSSREAYAQAISLRWQLTDDAFLLMGRVMDVVLSLAHRDDLSAGRLATRIKLVPDEGRDFPFLVVIETNATELLQRELSAVESWLGVGVAVQEPIEANYFGQGKCQMSGGQGGWLGGLVEFDGSERFFVTCSHVVSEHCGSLFTRSLLKTETYEPDAALLHSTIPRGCFEATPPFTNVTPVSESAARLLRKKHCRLRARARRGRIGEVIGWAEFSNRTHFFPHVQISPDVTILLECLAWPPWGRHFSRKGDSGSWVLSGKDTWLGMIVGGNTFRHLSYAVLSEPLLGYLQTLNPQGPNLSRQAAAYVEEIRYA